MGASAPFQGVFSKKIIGPLLTLTMARFGTSHATLNTPLPEPLPEAKAQDFTGREGSQNVPPKARPSVHSCMLA